MDLIWTVLAVAFLVGYFLLLFSVVLHVFRRPGLPGWERAAWFAAALAVPLLGLGVYLVVRYRPGGSQPGSPSAQGR